MFSYYLNQIKLFSMHRKVSAPHLCRACRHCSVCLNLRQIFILCSLVPLFPSSASFSEGSLHSLPALYSHRSKSRPLVLFIYAFLIPILLSWHTEINLFDNSLSQRFLLASVLLWALKQIMLHSNSQQRTSMDLSWNPKLCEVRECFRKERGGSGIACMVTNTWF